MISQISAYVVRAVYLSLITTVGMLGHTGTVIAYLPVYIVTLFTFWAAKKDERYYILDVYLSTVFIFGILLGLYGLMSETSPLLGVDKILHFAGGFGLSWFGFLWFEKRVSELKKRIWLALTLALLLGIMWEVFEWIIWVIPPHIYHAGWTDTWLDLVADMTGALFAVLAVIPRSRRSVFKARSRK